MPGRLLIVDNVATNRIVLKVKLASSGHDILQADTGTAALNIAAAEQPELIILDADAGDMSGLELCRRLKQDPATVAIPVIMMASATAHEARVAALTAGASELFEKPLDEMLLHARVRSLLRTRAQTDELLRRMATAREMGFNEAIPTYDTPGRLMLVGRTRDEALGWRAALKKHTTQQIDVIAPRDALLQANSGDVYIVSADLDQPGAGLRLVSELRSRAPTRFAGTIVVHDGIDATHAIMALDLGAGDLVKRGAHPAEMALRADTQLTQKRLGDRLRASVDTSLKMAMMDSLTGLHNRRYALAHLNKVSAESAKRGTAFAVMLVDVDRFKSVNDTWGHAAGDDVLAEIARRMQSNMRGEDLAARIGGEEFLIVMPSTGLVEARKAAERLRQTIAADPIAIPGHPEGITATVSIGLAMGGGAGTDLKPVEQIISVADRALYDAKAEGRNQVTLGSYAA